MLTPIKLFLRSIKRQKLFSFINILGLTVGFLCTTLIYLYVKNETSYDQFHENGDRIYRVNQTFIWGEDDSNIFSSTGPGVAHAISLDIPEAEQVVRVHTPELMPLRLVEGSEEKFFHDENVLAADSNFLKVFSYPLKYGDRNTALLYPNSVIISEEAAARYFGDVNPVGELLDLGGGEIRETFKVTGVVTELQENSYIEFDLMISLNSIDRISRSNWSWMWTTFETFIVLNDQANPKDVQGKLSLLPKKHAVETLEVMGYTYDEYIESGKEWNLYLQPFQDIHLYSNNIYNRLNTVGNHKIVKALGGSAIFIIILSCINFINLSTSQFTTKAKNVALRKVLGSGKAALRKIYLTEAFMYGAMSAIISLGLLFYVLPFFNTMVGLDLSFSPIQDPGILLFLLAIIGSVTLLSGLYPAIFFSAFKPISAMRGELKTGNKGAGLRSGMMVVQYVLSLLLIICSGVVYQQLKYVYNADLGFKKDQVITVDNVHWMNSSNEFAEELRKIEGVNAAALCDATPLLVYNGDQFMPDKTDGGSVALNYTLGDENYIPLLELEMVVGRNFDRSFADDVNGIVLNESAAMSIGWSLDESILNKKISNWSGTYHVIGVVRDFNYWALSAIEPFAIFHDESNAQGGRPISRVAVSLEVNSSAEVNEIMASLETKWNEFLPNRPFEYTILDQVFESSYESENRFGNVLTMFTSLTLVIAGLGLLGMVIFTIEQKTKEIGIRKVLGASMLGIASLFTSGYIKLLCVAFLIAVPLGYYLMQQWLFDFEYRITISPMIFVVAGGSLLFISIAISSYHSIKASLLNPAEVLKDE
ncbi:MAG: ABC transporter permease [Cyclobacteriaceae bacterium]